MNRRKKVKFWDHENTRNQRIRSPAVGDGKTSEYKSFQKLLGKCHPNRSPRYNNDSRKLDANDKRNNPADTKFHGKMSISPALVFTPIAQRPFSSTNTILRKSDLNDLNDNARNTMNNVQSTIQKGVFDPWGSSRSPGPENKFTEIFSSKRENLLKVAARTLTCKADDIISNKSNLIQECLQRLSTGQKSANADEISKPRKKASRARYHSQASMRSHGEDNEMQDLQERRDIYSTMERKDDPFLPNQHCYRADDLFAPIFPNLQFISYSNADEEFEFHTKYNTIGHIPLKAPTTQSIEWYSDSMFDEEKQYKSTSNRNSHIFPYRREMEEQQIVPYSNSNTSYNFCDQGIYPQLIEEKYSNFPLLEYYDMSTKLEYSDELDSLPVTLYHDHNTVDQIENNEEIDFFGKKDIFRSPPIGNYDEYQYDDEEWCTNKNRYDGCVNKNRYDGCVNKNDLMEMERYLPLDISTSYNFDIDRETSFFDMLSVPERFS